MDGKIIIGTTIDNSGFDKQYDKLQAKAKNKEIEIDVTSKELSKEQEELDRLYDTIGKLGDKEEEINNKIREQEKLISKITTKTKEGIVQIPAGNYEAYNNALMTIQDLKANARDIAPEIEKTNKNIDKQEQKVAKINAKYEKQKTQLAEIKQQQQDMQTNQLSNIGKSLSGVVKKVTRWGLAIFGIRSAYLAVRSAMNTLTQDDEQLKADIDYIKNSLAYVLEPVVRKVVELAKQLVFYLGYLIKAWTGHNIFASANKNLKKSVGSAKELKKQLAGFDEMNVISDTSSGGASGGAIPSFNFEDMEVPDWLVKIKEIGLWIIDNWEDVVGILLLTKLFIDILTGNWLGVIIDLVLLLIDLFFKVKDAIKVIADNWKESWQLVADFMMNKVIKPIGDWFSNLWQKIKDGVASAVQWIKDKFNSIKDFFKSIISTIVGFFKTIGTKVGDAIGGAFKAVINGVLKAIENILNFPIRQINKLLDVINDVPGINIKKLSTFNLPRLAKGGIINMPGRGVPVGSAIGGERGQEGVIPLTDSQQMMLLGEAIGKFVNINANIPVYVGNRLLLREMKRIEAEDNFAYNR